MTTSRLVIVAGKGGVGKTTVAATLAKVAAAQGEVVTAVSIGDDRLGAVLGLDPVPATALLSTESQAGEIRLTRLDPEGALGSYLDDNGLKSLGKRMSRAGMLQLVATATPGIRELLLLGGLRQLESSEHTGLVVVDAPAAGHAISLLRAPATMQELAKTGRLRQQADQALEMLSDPRRSQVVLVTLPEHTPVRETIETAFSLEDEIGLQLGPVVVNRCEPDAPACAPPTGELIEELSADDAALIDRALDEAHVRHRLQREQIDALAEQLSVGYLALPDLPTPSGRLDIDELSGLLRGRT